MVSGYQEKNRIIKGIIKKEFQINVHFKNPFSVGFQLRGFFGKNKVQLNL